MITIHLMYMISEGLYWYVKESNIII